MIKDNIARQRQLIQKRLVPQDIIKDMLDKARNTPPGCFVEVGIYHGWSASFLYELAQEQNREIYLYDTFSGIPYDDPVANEWDIGHLANTDYQGICELFPKAHVIKGIFPDSAVDMPKVAFAHLDVDAYRSVMECTLYLRPKMERNGIIWYDDSPVLKGAHKAVISLYGDTIKLSKTHRHYMVH